MARITSMPVLYATLRAVSFRAAEIMFYGMGGEMYSTGTRDREPLKMAANIVLYQAGAAAAVATMGAVYAAMGQGSGQQVDVSIMETQVGSIDRRMSNLVAFQYICFNGANASPLSLYCFGQFCESSRVYVHSH